ncbi:serine hydrolase [Paenibacillus antri]|uniref:Serine hydrolase n=1 Tax=Paenibacillus antri TaxID=2582848 RepID=A0A5R9GBX1_9BACL|nr:serine hydrolase [Paenibacillus antri]TLS51560.1 serine hydrolase [Paenibacillus antri]
MGIGAALPRSAPEAQGVRSGAIEAFLDEVRERKSELHSFMLVRHGRVVAEGWWSPYRAADRHMLFSLSKSFTSTAVGFALSEGLLSLEDRVVGFFGEEDLPADVSPSLAEMRVRDLLMMGTGHAAEPTLHGATDGNWAKAFLSAPVEFAPGTKFVYNSGATYMLSAILRRATGQSLLEYLDSRLLAPLGIVGATWESCPRGIAVGGWGLSVTTEDIAKFGQLYLQRGVWNGRQLLPYGWAEEASRKHISNGDGGDSDWAQGYGYQFWRCRHGAYRGDGAFGQFCVVLPEQDAVLAITSGTNDMQAVLNAAWDTLLPAMAAEALPADAAAADALASRLGALRLDPPPASSSPSGERLLDGRTYALEPNWAELASIGFEFPDGGQPTVVIGARGGDGRLPIGRGAWSEGETRFHSNAPERVVGAYAWRDERTLEIAIRFVETPFAHTLACRVKGDDAEELELELTPNVSFGKREAAPIRGTRK